MNIDLRAGMKNINYVIEADFLDASHWPTKIYLFWKWLLCELGFMRRYDSFTEMLLM